LDETGTGIGPTLEFYSLFSKEIASVKSMWFKTKDFSLYPAIFANESEFLSFKQIFSLLGYVVARGLYDDILINIPLNSVFWDIILDRPINIKKVSKIDDGLGKLLRDLKDIVDQKHKIIHSSSISQSDLGDHLKFNNTKIEEMDLSFTFPGYETVNLLPDGSNLLVGARNSYQKGT
jgi:E3 ubiquitin-protein ligase TRIP12